jgi:trk system potassium uptake protein
MQIMVIGCGKVGSSLARELVENGNNVVIIENDKKLLENANSIDCMKINGIPIDKDLLKNAGIDQADALCAVTQDDNMNIMTAQVAKEIFKVNKVIARIFNPQSKELFEEFGLETVCSTSLTVNAILRSLEHERDDAEHMIFGEDLVFTKIIPEYRHYGMEVTEYSRAAGKHVMGIIRNGKWIITLPGMRIEKGDTIVLCRTNE